MDQQRCPFLVLLRVAVKTPGVDDKISTLDEAFPPQPIE